MIDESTNTAFVVDLDGTLLKSDSLWESIIRMAAVKPWRVFFLPIWLMHGRVFLKWKCASYVVGDVADWPYNADVIEIIEKAKAAGRTICLATAADSDIARSVAEYLGLFDRVFTSEKGINLKGKVKLTRLREEFGDRNFDYMGDGAVDLPIFAECRNAYLVGNPGTRLARKIAAANQNLNFVSSTTPSNVIGGGYKRLAKTIRAHQWIKNIFIFVPFFLARDFTLKSALSVTLGAVAFAFCASCIYIINDLVDLPHDRRHQKKKNRPFAAGEVSLCMGPVLAVLAAMLAVVAAWMLPVSFAATLVAYFILTCLYSWRLKRVVMLDVIVLAGFYVLRLIAGMAVLDLPMSNWLLGYGALFFLGLGILKRTSEMRASQIHKSHEVREATLDDKILPGRSYREEDLQVLESMAVASGFSSVTVLALYIDSMSALKQYSHSFFLWGLCPLMVYWYGRILIAAHRGELIGDPVAFVVKDRISLFCGGMVLLCLIAAV